MFASATNLIPLLVEEREWGEEGRRGGKREGEERGEGGEREREEKEEGVGHGEKEK